MFMRQMIKQGEMFKLDRKPKNSDSNHQIDTNTELQDEQQYGVNQVRPRKSHDFQMNVDELAMKNSPAIIIAGMAMCCCMAVLGSLIFYFFIFDFIKPYIPNFAYDYIPFLEKPPQPVQIQLPQPIFLSQQNAKQYFAQNQLIAGEFHYARVPVQYWKHRIETIKSMGMNALSVYVFWNYHQVSKELARQYNMSVLLRPGPYVCAEWDFGGLPPRFLNIEGMKIRENNPLFLAQTKIYFSELSKIIKKYIKNKDNAEGPILMMQVENEPSWLIKDKTYILALKKLWDQINLGCPLFFDDIKDGYGSHRLYWDNAILAVNQQLFSKEDYEKFKKQDNFVFWGEVYSGWFSSWGKQDWEAEFKEKYNKHFYQQFDDMLAVNASFSMFLAHGGTNFGLTVGYNLTTSYDYDSPINEQGRITQKYHIFKSLVSQYQNKTMPRAPEPIQTMAVQLGQVQAVDSFIQFLPQPIIALKPLVFESKELAFYNQGLVLYETTIKGPAENIYEILVHDVALIYLDNQYKETVVRTKKQVDLDKELKTFKIKCEKSSCQLRILVEPMGHVNFGPEQKLDHKGILRFREKESKSTTLLTQNSWRHFTFSLKSEPYRKLQGKCQRAPCLYAIQKELNETKDTYISMEGFKKGYVWVNGRNLGRYWQVGPQLSLYCPGVWLKKGKNTITILDLYVVNANINLKTAQKPILKQKNN